MFLHENKEVFQELLTQTAEEYAPYTEDIIEKDYYVYLLLKKIHELCPEVVFKGGTSLSKCYNVIHRFSEDIDLTFIKEIKKEKRSKKIKHGIIKETAKYYNFTIPNFDSKEAQGDCNVPRFHFKTPAIADYTFSDMDPNVTIECSFLSPCANPKAMVIDCFIQRFIEKRSLEAELRKLNIEALNSFEMNVQPMEITFIDKVYALCDYFLDPKHPVEKHSRHLYDIYMMSSLISFDENFKSLVQEIRKHRSTLEKCFSTLPDETRTIKELVEEYIASDYYKGDYSERTLKLIEEKNITYDMVINRMKNIVATNIF